jgi:DUF4097 and DUF4098 domain-containing protein YvlB
VYLSPTISGNIKVEITREAYLEGKIRELEQQLQEAKDRQISGFWADEHPQFRQGEPTHEMEELLDAETVNGIIKMFKEYKNANPKGN